jgi:hypothetical protein
VHFAANSENSCDLLIPYWWADTENILIVFDIYEIVMVIGDGDGEVTPKGLIGSSGSIITRACEDKPGCINAM